MRASSGSACAAAALALNLLAGALPTPGAAATPPAPSKPRATPADELDEWDRSLATLRTGIWLLHAGTAARGADPRGRTIDEDIAEWLTTPDSIVTLERARRDAGARLAAGDRAGMTAALDAGRVVRARWLSRLALLDLYWSARAALDYQSGAWGRWAARAPASARAQSRAHLQALEADLAARLVPGVTQGELRPALEDLGRAYNAEREKLARLVGTNGDDGRVPSPRASRLLCHGGEAPEPTGPSSPPAQAIYPRDAQRLGVWGEVRLALALSATGCALSSRVLSSSGAALLDAAALDWVEYAHFEPAQMGGHPIASTTVIRLAFVLPGRTPDPTVDAATARRNRPMTDLGGIALGITRRELEKLKGRPAATTARQESFNSLDAAHDGVLTATFGAEYTDDADRVVGVDYVGDGVSAPHELPPLRGLTRKELYAQVGEPQASEQLSNDSVRLRYPSGLYVNVGGGQVTGYGIAPTHVQAPPEIRMTIESSTLPARPAPPVAHPVAQARPRVAPAPKR